MIKPHQRKLIAAACAKLKVEPHEFQPILERWGEARTIDALGTRGYNQLMDYLTVCGFVDRRRPVLTLHTCRLVDNVFDALRWSPMACRTFLCEHGVADLRDHDGRKLLAVLISLEKEGLAVNTFLAARREITASQVKLIHLARKQVAMADEKFLPLLQCHGGVNSPADLDRRGFDLMMTEMASHGFDRNARLSSTATFGERPGFATSRQVQLIRTIWREWSGAEDEVALNAWLERFHKVSNLRFLTDVGARKVIASLRAMKRRSGTNQRVSA